MEQNLIEGCNNRICPPAGSGDPLFVQIKRAVRITDGIAMQLTNGTLQVILKTLYVDRFKLIIFSKSLDRSTFQKIILK